MKMVHQVTGIDKISRVAQQMLHKTTGSVTRKGWGGLWRSSVSHDCSFPEK